jgi:hypothetical protein
MSDEACPKTEFLIARLIEEKYGVRIDPKEDKAAFREELNQTTGTKYYGKLVENLSEEEVVKFFPQLLHVLKAVESLIEP